MQKYLPIIAILLISIKSCFITHFVYYGKLPQNDYNRISQFKYPYIMHLNQDIRFPKNYSINRDLSPVQKSDIKKMQVIYHHGGLYLDNDHLIDMQCIRKIFCSLSKGLYVMDWTDRLGDVWIKSIPISFIYSTHQFNDTIQQILTSYNQSNKQAIDFSGPYHAQKFREGFSFVKVNRSCQYHFGMMTWSSGISMETVWWKRKLQQIKQQNKFNKINKKIKQQYRQLLQKLWSTHSVIYPNNFQYDKFIKFDPYFNHVQIIDKVKLKFKVIQYSQDILIQNKLRKIVKQYENKQVQYYQKQKQPKIQFDLYEQGEFNQKHIQNIQNSQFNLNTSTISIIILLIIILYSIINIICIKLTKNKRNKLKQQYMESQSSTRELDTNEQNHNVKRISNKTQIKSKQNQCYKIKSIKNSIYLISFSLLILILLIFFQFNRVQISDQQKFIQKYGIELQNIKKQTKHINFSQYNIQNHLQIQSQLDYLNLNKTQQFNKFKNQYLSQIKYQFYKFKYNPYFQHKQQKIKYQIFLYSQSIQRQLTNIQKWRYMPKIINNTKAYLSSYLSYGFEKNKSKQLQYYFYNKIYNLDSIIKQQPICIIIAGYQIYSKNKYKRLFKSIQYQNYTNYQIILIDDFSSDNSAYQIYNYINNQQELMKVKNRIRIIRNKKKISQLGSIYKWSSFCKQNSIVINMNIWAKFIGYQTFKIINSVYQNKSRQIWFTQINYLMQSGFGLVPKIGQNLLQFQQINDTNYRQIIDIGQQQVITFRKQLIKKIPIQYLIQYYYRKQENTMVPKFYYQSAQNILSYSLIQLSGKDRVAVIKQPLYLFQQNYYKSCGKQKQKFIEYKARLKYSFDSLKSIKSEVVIQNQKQIDSQFLSKFRNVYSVYQRCLAVFDPPNNLQ